LHPDEIKRFLEALRAEADSDARDFFLLLLFTGARKSEVLRMRWGDVNLESGVWTNPDTKTGDAVTVPLSAPALAVLTARTDGGRPEWVFPSSGATGHLVEPKKAWTRILKRAAIQGLWMHDLRRTLGSWMAATGANLSIIAKALGHKNLTTTTRYARLDLDPIRRATQTAADAMMLSAGPALTQEFLVR
ncbi:MAG: site-specific integrase, partial [Bryobacteraceae bacterium]